MKRHLNTLFITTQGTYLAKEGQAVVVREKKQTLMRVPLLNLDGIVCFGRVGCSPILMAACAEANITISYLSESGRFLAAVVGFSPGNVLLRREQYRRADDLQAAALIARNSVSAKIANCRSVLLRAARDTKETTRKEALQLTAKTMERQLSESRTATELERLRGIEGESASTYFAVFNHLLQRPRTSLPIQGAVATTSIGSSQRAALISL